MLCIYRSSALPWAHSHVTISAARRAVDEHVVGLGPRDARHLQLVLALLVLLADVAALLARRGQRRRRALAFLALPASHTHTREWLKAQGDSPGARDSRSARARTTALGKLQ